MVRYETRDVRRALRLIQAKLPSPPAPAPPELQDEPRSAPQRELFAD